MRAAVQANAISFLTTFEGSEPFMYLDRHVDKTGKLDPLVTTAIGLLIDPVESALALPWRVATDPSLRRATEEEIRAQWMLVKSHPELALRGGGAYRPFAQLTLTPEDIQAITVAKLLGNEATFRGRYPAWDSLPSDAQLAIHSMAWMAGPLFRFPRFDAAINARQFDVAANESGMVNGAPARNEANKLLLQNAAFVEAQGLDPEPLRWPSVASQTVFTEVDVPISKRGGGLVAVLAMLGGAAWLLSRR